MFLVGGVDLVTPLVRLLIQILPTGEGTPGQKVAFDKAERSFYASGTIRITDLMGHELKTETLAEGSHLGHRLHLAPGAAQHHHMRVIDHDAGRAAREATQRVGEKHLAVKTLEARVGTERTA